MSRQIGVTLVASNSIPRLLEGSEGNKEEEKKKKKNPDLNQSRGTTVVFAQFTVA